MITAFKRRMQGSGGGGNIGQVIGGGVGAIASTFTPAGPLPGYSAGSSVGGLIGGVAAPPKAAQVSEAPQTAMERRRGPDLSQYSPVLEDSLRALQEAPPDVQEAYAEPLMKAHKMSRIGRVA